ncbi:MAG TPA: type II secretion system F family protein [Gemmataceae bacterium]|nr:type II secretion system F family protein [Gemmataceae bacterium]
MTFFRRLRLAELIELCRSMRFALESGLMLRDVMDLLSSRNTRRVRLLAAEISKEIKSGWSLQDALAKQGRALPPLFISLVTVGEETGNLPEVLGELEKYYILQQKLRREFREQIAWPVLQFAAAVIVVTLLIYILGILPQAASGRDSKPLDPLGLGLVGERGAMIFFGSVCGIVAGLMLLYFLTSRLLRRRAVIERMLLMVPGIGPCLRALALARFCIAARLMLETSLSVLKTLRLAFLATDNAAFAAVIPRVETSLRQGNSITTSFGKGRIFPQKFLSAVGVAEESGRLPEIFRHQGEEYDDEARRRLNWLTRLSSGLVWLCVAAVIISCIFNIFLNVYYGNIMKALPN